MTNTNQNKTQTKLQRGIAKRLIISLTFGIFIVLSIMSALQIYVAFTQGQSLLKKDLHQYALMAAPTFSQPLWNVDLNQTYMNINGLLQGDNVYGVLVLDEKGKEFASFGSILHKNTNIKCIKEPSSKDFSVIFTKQCLKTISQFIFVSEPIMHDGHLLGSITLFGNRDKVTQLITPLIIATLVSALVIMLALTIVALFVIERRIGIPLRSLTKQILQAYDRSNILIISSEYTRRDDELGQLSQSFGDMITKLTTYQNHLEDLVAERTEKLHIANAAKSDFLSNMSHEIRTPINGILGITELMLHETLPPDLNNRIQMIHNSGNHLLKIVNDILDLSKIEAGKLHLESLPTQLNQLCNEITDFFSTQQKLKSISFITEIDNQLPEAIYCDPLRLKQILINLINNAFKFTDNGKITLRISKLNDDKIQFSVSDTGVGIDQGKMADIFLAFKQADSSTTRKYGGTGLGLSISKELVELMQGEIAVTSDAGKGSTFFFTLPLLAANNTNPALISKTPITTSNAKLKESLKILIAEDNQVNQFVIKGMLNRLGANPEIINNGKAVVDWYAESDPCFDLIFMDCEMPIMDGWEATQQLRARNIKRHNGSPVLIFGLSAHAIEGASERAIAAGMDDYLTKPLSLDTLIVKMKEHDLLI